MKDRFTLKEIANWQLYPADSFVELPSIQRGFVWKPKQVEDLWDSILRGFPIGSLLFSKTGDKLHLMDGQQRATSIFLGHFNPYKLESPVKAWTINGALPVVWIDIHPENWPDRSKYLVRLTTRSHPWGYQARENNKTLRVSEKKKARDLFEIHPDNKNIGYTSFKNTTTFPYDAWFPLPLCFFIESNTPKEIIEKARRFLPEYFCTSKGGFSNKEEFINKLENELNSALVELWQTVMSAKDLCVLYNIIEDRVLNEENEGENPTLFVRINSSGTTLTGDDLNYSIYKSLFPEGKQLIESAGLDFVEPTQVLSLATRIVASDLENHSYIRKLTVRDFQRRIKNEDFKNGLANLIESKELKERFAQAIEILSCKNNSLFEGEVPPVIIKQLIRKNQDVFLFLVYWLHCFQYPISDEIQLKIVAKTYTFAWFNFGNFPDFWNEKISNPNFWSEPLNELLWWNNQDGVDFLTEPKLLRKYYAQSKVFEMFRDESPQRWKLLLNGIGEEVVKFYENVKKESYTVDKIDDFFSEFVGKIRHNKSLILLAQRNYINSKFGDYNQMEDIEDTNVPWDWDHIYPSEWVYRKQYCNQGIKDWNNTNGNFRALALEQNRSERNIESPKSRLDTEEKRELSFVKDEWSYWQNIEDRLWDDNIENHFQGITSRMINIYEKFWNDFKIDELIILRNVEKND
ncbi:hypothetical protein CEY12_01205 [Chryseobacterium sp. T16E-39]|uniref:DUF262 domain-containing protein n=1 Tax=Chryseobacterium sp. T16E-39 TaxID=2015076 RepID=UPI000B5B0D3D|nr:DUF262 domain-containing protein [Chryseobacterium sp. T16E-39]ASK28807.1 hypothetical protein CEY12_01205 [Chryseobacterium sp. T16E-39]